MALSELKKKYFDQGIREHLAEDYFMIMADKLFCAIFLNP